MLNKIKFELGFWWWKFENKLKILKDKLHIVRYVIFCRKYKECVVLSWNQEWILCNDKKCPLHFTIGLTRAYKKAEGTYEKDKDIFR